MSIVLSELSARMRALYGPRLDRLVLYGSRPRGDGEPDADIDVLVVVSDETAIKELKDGALNIVCDMSLKYDTPISCVYTTPQRIDLSGMPYYRNVRREGVRI
ncbi:MAG: nucleotidyltransferase domain-containing protein [Pseudomonadota bacterium]